MRGVIAGLLLGLITAGFLKAESVSTEERVSDKVMAQREALGKSAAVLGATVEVSEDAPQKKLKEAKYREEHAAYTEAASAGKPPTFLEELIRQRTIAWRRHAKMALKARDYEAAEKYYFEILNNGSISNAEQKEVFIEMADLYEKQKNEIKTIAVYETFLELYPDDEMNPRVHMKVGDLYRDIGAFKFASEHYYKILNLALKSRKGAIEEYREISLQAQLKLAETEAERGNFESAERFYQRLAKLDLPADEHAKVLFQRGYLETKIGSPGKAIPALKEFIETYPRDSRVPEAHYLISDSYRKMNQSEKAVQEIFVLLKKNHNLARIDSEEWVHWKRRAGNQIANQFYKQGDYHNALRLYQAITPLSTDPQWQWETVYQIGLCFERLSVYGKAREACQWIVQGGEQAEAVSDLSKNLEQLQNMAKWRLKEMIAIDKHVDAVNNLLILEPASLP